MGLQEHTPPNGRPVLFQSPFQSPISPFWSQTGYLPPASYTTFPNCIHSPTLLDESFLNNLLHLSPQAFNTSTAPALHAFLNTAANAILLKTAWWSHFFAQTGHPLKESHLTQGTSSSSSADLKDLYNLPPPWPCDCTLPCSLCLPCFSGIHQTCYVVNVASGSACVIYPFSRMLFPHD